MPTIPTEIFLSIADVATHLEIIKNLLLDK